MAFAKLQYGLAVNRISLLEDHQEVVLLAVVSLEEVLVVLWISAAAVQK